MWIDKKGDLLEDSAQSEIYVIISSVIAAIFGIIILGMLVNSITCTQEKNQIAELKGLINQKNLELTKTLADVNFYKSEYESLRDYNITKQDFVDLKAQINDLNYNYSLINNNLTSINQVMLNTFNSYNISFVLNLVLLPFTLFTLFDFAFLNFKFSNKIRKIIIKKYKSTIKIFSKNKED